MKTRRRSLLKRGLSFFIAMTMCLSMLQMPVFAAEESYAKESAVTEISVQGGLSGEGLSENSSEEKTSSEEASEKNDRVEADDKENKEEQSAKAEVKEEKEASKEVSDGGESAEKTPEKAGTADESSDKDVSVNDAGDGKDAANAAGDGEDAASGAEDGNDAVNSAGNKEKPGENTSEKEEFTDKTPGKEEVTDGAADKDSAIKDSAEKNSGKEDSAGNHSGTETVGNADKASNEEKPAADKTDKQPTDTENQDKSKPAEEVKADKKVQESTGTKASSQVKSSSRIPGAVKAFLDAVAAIPEITPDNAEEAAEYIYGEVSDAYEELLGTEYEDREDVQKAAAVMHKAMEAVDAALKIAEIENYATLEDFMEACDAIGDADDIESVLIALDKIEAVYHRLSDENKEMVSDEWAYIQDYMADVRGGNLDEELEVLKLISGEQFTVNVVKVECSGNKVATTTLTQNCLQSTGHSGYNHSTNLRTLAELSGFSGYKGYNWSKYTTVPSSYTSGLAPNNNYASVHYNITGSAPYKADETLFLFFGHSYSQTKEPNCINPGLKTCSKCGAEVTVPALGHNFLTIWTDNCTTHTDLTCTGHTKVCTRCNGTLSGGIRTDTHNYGEWVTVTEAKPGVEGKQKRTCKETGCGHYETQAISALPVTPDPGTTTGSFTVKKSFSGLENGVLLPNFTLTYEAWRTKDGVKVGEEENGKVSLSKNADGTYSGIITPIVWDILTSGNNALSETERSRYKNVIVITESNADVAGYSLTFKPEYVADGTAQKNKVTFIMDGATSGKNLSLKNSYTKNDDGKGIEIKKERTNANNKGEGGNPFVIGEMVTWDIKITNRSETSVRHVYLTESMDDVNLKLNGNILEYENNTKTTKMAIEVPANETVTVQASHVITQADYDNGTPVQTDPSCHQFSNTISARTEETNPLTNEVYSAFGVDGINNVIITSSTDKPKLEVEKEVQFIKAPNGDIRYDRKAQPGDTVQYLIKVTNKGKDDVTGVVIV